MATLLSLLQDVCDFGGFPRPTSIINSSDATARQLLAIANERGAEAVRMFDWPQLTKLSSLTLTPGVNQTLPADCAELLDQTAWYTGDMTPLRGPITPQEWQRLTQTASAGIKFAFRMTQNSTLKRAVAMHPTPIGNETISIFYRSKTWIKPRDYTPGMTVTTGMWCFSDGEYWTANGNGTAGATAPTGANNGATSPVAWTLRQNVLYERFTADSDEPLIESSVLMKGILARFYRMKGLEYQDLEAEFYSGLRNDLAERNGSRTDNLFRRQCCFIDTTCADVGFIGGPAPTPEPPVSPEIIGGLFGWGFYDSNIIFGVPAYTGSWNVPTQLQLGEWKDIHAGPNHAIGLKADNSIWAWGFGGLLGQGTGYSNTEVPVEVVPGTTWKSIAAGFDWSVAVKSDGTLWEWGVQGGYGREDLNDRYLHQVGTDTDWDKVYMSTMHSFARKTDGSWWGWNRNVEGQLGALAQLGNTLLTPVAIPNSSDWKSVYLGGRSTIVIKNDGTAWGMGRNDAGQLGFAIASAVGTPTQINFDTNWESFAVNRANCWGVKTDGTLWAAGQNVAAIGLDPSYPAKWEVGDTITNTTTFTQIGTDADWDAVYSNKQVSDFSNFPFVFAIKSNKTLWGWGFNNAGIFGGTSTIGDNTTTPRNAPVQITSPKNWGKFSVGNTYTLAIVGA